jgi:hypothetical protein
MTEGHVIEALQDDHKVFEALQLAVVWRSFPISQLLTIESANVLSAVLKDGYVLFDGSAEGIRYCYERGWIHRARAGKDSVLVFPSRLHEK